VAAVIPAPPAPVSLTGHAGCLCCPRAPTRVQFLVPGAFLHPQPKHPCRNYTGIHPVPNAATTLSLVGGAQAAKTFLLPHCRPCREPNEWQSSFSPQNRLHFAAVLRKQALPPWPQRGRDRRVPSSTSSRCPLLPTPPLQSDSLHLSFQL